MNIKEIEKLPLVDQMYLLKQNGNKVNIAKIKRNIAFYEGKHPILYDDAMADYWVEEERMNPDGTVAKTADGKIIYDKVCIKRTRLVFPYVQQIVGSMVAWLYGNDITVVMNGDRNNEDQKAAFEKLQEILEYDVRLMSVLKEATRDCGIETRSAIQFLWDDDEKRIKAKVLSYRNGYQIWRHKNDFGSIDCVIVEYKRDYIKDGKLRKDVLTTEKWTADGMIRYEGLEEVDKMEAPINKLLFDYLEQDECEFEHIKPIVSKQDYARSQHSEVNTKIGSPSLVVYGKLKKKPTTSGGVQIFEVNTESDYDGTKLGNARMEYLQLETAPESVKLEMTMNENDIYRFTWPDLNKLMTDMKNGNLSTQSMKLTFLQAFVKLAEKQEQHDEFVQRALNIVKDMAAELYPECVGMKDLKVSFNYNSILPDSTSEMINMLAVAVGAGITSVENAVRILTINTPETMEEIMRERLDKAVNDIKVAEANNPVVEPADPAKPVVENTRNKSGINGW